MRWTTVFACSERWCWRHHTSNVSSFNMGSSSFRLQIFSVCWYTRGNGKGLTRQGLSGKLCFFDNFRPLYGCSTVPFQGSFSIRKRQIMLHGVRICFLSAPNYGISHTTVNTMKSIARSFGRWPVDVAVPQHAARLPDTPCSEVRIHDTTSRHLSPVLFS